MHQRERPFDVSLVDRLDQLPGQALCLGLLHVPHIPDNRGFKLRSGLESRWIPIHQRLESSRGEG